MKSRLAAILACSLLAPCARGAAAGADEAGARAADAAGAEASTPLNPRYVLQDPQGRMVGNEDFPGRFQLLTFGYTMCPDVCPMTLARMARAAQLLGEQGRRLQLVFITVDPERDTGEVLARYAAYFDARLVALTGTPERIRVTAEHFRVRYRRYAEPGAAPDAYSVDHTVGSYLLGPDGEFITRFAEDTPAEDLAARIRAVMAQARARTQ
jgi:cytochrome oxidase Cu insertion factor (SCO1/SenC/PrrC family)